MACKENSFTLSDLECLIFDTIIAYGLQIRILLDHHYKLGVKDHCTCTTLTDFSTKYLMMNKVYTDVGGIK